MGSYNDMLSKIGHLVLEDFQFTSLLRPRVVGIEVTQAIQYFHAVDHLSDANDRGADNSVTLVRGKAAWVRVYVRNWFGPAQSATGQLKIERAATDWGLNFNDVMMLAPLAPGSAVAQRFVDYATERSTIGGTLNFVIPADQMFGRLRLTASIWSGSGSESDPDDTESIAISARLHQTLRLRGILISYNGTNAAGTANLNLAAPTVGDLITTAGWSLRTMPVASQGEFSSGGTITWSTPLTGVATSPGGCSTQWLNLNAAVAQARTNDGNRAGFIYYGLLPVGVPIANVGGCESSGVSTGSNQAGVTMAHEIGHGCGLAHGPCGTPGDPNYPAYEPYDPANTPTSSLGEYGLDVIGGNIHLPAEKDLMSYCSGNWFSLYHYQRLIDNQRLNPVWTRSWRPPDLVDPYLWPWEILIDPNPPDPPWQNRFERYRDVVQPIISVIAVIDRDRIDVQSVMRLEASTAILDARPTDMTVELIGAEGEPIAQAPLMLLPSQGGGCACKGGGPDEDPTSYIAQALLPNVDGGAALRIVRPAKDKREPEVVWEQRATEKPPNITEFNVRADRHRLHARWAAKGGNDAGLSYALQFSKDGGRTWNGLAVGINEKECTLEADHLPAGELLFRLLAHDGFQTARRDAGPVEMPERPPLIAILSPRPGEVFDHGAPVSLWVTVDTRDGSRLRPKSVHWEVDGAPVGQGAELWLDRIEPGRHRATVIVEGRHGQAQESVEFECGAENDWTPPNDDDDHCR